MLNGTPMHRPGYPFVSYLHEPGQPARTPIRVEDGSMRALLVRSPSGGEYDHEEIFIAEAQGVGSRNDSIEHRT